MMGSAIEPVDIWSSQSYDLGALQHQGHCCNPTTHAGGTPPATSLGIATSGDFADSDLAAFGTYYGLAWNVKRMFVLNAD